MTASQTNRLSKVFILSLFIFALAACNLPIRTQPAVHTALPPTATTPPTTQGTAVPPTKVPAAPPTQPPSTPTLAPIVTPQAIVRGFAIFDKPKSEVRGYDLASKAMLFSYKVAGVDYMGFGLSQMVGDTLFYFSQSEKTVIAVTKGTTTRLNFLPKDPSIVFSISTDGKKIAWVIDLFDKQNPSSELWTAAIDGSGAQKISSIAAAANSKWLALRPYKWLADGRLLYIESPTGIGGYILFYGFASISLYDPANAAKPTIPLLEASSPGAGFLCLHGISPELKNVITSCGTKTQGQLALEEISSAKMMPIQVLPEQRQAGSTLYSPSGSWLAYAAARGQMDNETGKVAILPASGLGAPNVITSFANGYVQVADWVDEDHLLLESYQSDIPTIWLINRDGSGLTKLEDGFYVGLLK